MITALHRRIISLAQLPAVRKAAVGSKITTPLVQRFVGGDTPAEAIAVAITLQQRGIGTALDLLGENVETEADATQATDEYIRVLDLAAEAQIETPYLSVKLTALGLDVSDSVATANLRRLARSAGTAFIRVDMESSHYTQKTIDIVTEVHQDFKNVGTVLQSYLFRTEADIEHAIEHNIPIRLVKGAYLEPETVAYQSMDEIVRAYRRHLARLLRSELPLAVATHDERLISTAKKQIRESRRPNDSVEFQLLLGIREDIRDHLVSEGYHVRIYCPFGSQWYPYLVRRLAERPANLTFMARQLTHK